MKRQLIESEKLTVREQQLSPDGSLRCFISGDIISDQDEIEFDHIKPFSKNGETSVSNIRIVLKKYNRRKSDQSLYEVRDNMRLERLFDSKKNNITLQDILDLKEINRRNKHATKYENSLSVDDGQLSRVFSLLHDEILGVAYFYGQIPIAWLENDDQEGLQPRVIDYKRLITLRDHLKTHPQLAPSIGRLLGNSLKLFDGQHKLAAQVLNGLSEVDVKVFISPEDQTGSKKLFDALMITNLEAHSKLKQVPFYTSTLLDRLSVIYREFLEEFISTQSVENHSEENFVQFTSMHKQLSKPKVKEMLRSAIKRSVLDNSKLAKYVAEASKDPSYPITFDLLNMTVFPATLYLDPSSARFDSDLDFRNSEAQNFADVMSLLVHESCLENWVQNVKGRTLTNEQLKARRIWHKGSVLTWSPYLKSILYFALQFTTNDEREKMLYRSPITARQQEIISICLSRLFGHPIWDEPEGEIDSLLVSARKQDDLFERKGLTEKFVIHGQQ